MSPPRRASRAVPYVVAVLGPLATGLLRFALDPIWGNKFPFTTFYPAVALAAWVGGLGPGLVATAVATVGAIRFLPAGTVRVEQAPDFIALVLFTSINTFISVLSEALHRARRRAEVTSDVLRRSEARVKAIITSATDGIITIDARQRITVFSTGAEAIFGYSADEMIGQTLDRLVPERFHLVHREHVDAFGRTDVSTRAMGGERVLVGLRRDGAEFPMEARISQVDVGSEKLYTVILRDVTERQQAAARATRDHEAASRLYEIGQRCVRPADHFMENLSAMLDTAIWISQADKGNVQLYDERSGMLNIAVHRGFDAPFIEFFASVERDDPSACATALAAAARVVIEDVTTSEIFAGQPALQVLLDAGVRAVQSTPLVSSRGTVIGMVSTHFGRPHRPSTHDCQLLDELARQAADYVERKRAEEQRDELLGIAERARADAERAADTVHRVQRITDAIMRELPLDPLLHEVLARVREAVNADLAAVLLSSRDGDDGALLRIRETIGIGNEVPRDFGIPVGRGFAGQVARERRAIVWDEVKPDDVFAPCRKTVRALAGVPLLSGDRLLGVLLVGTVRPRRFEQEDIDLLQLAGERIALGIERAARGEAESRAREALEASNRAKDEFLAMLSHELRNPLAAIHSAVAAARLNESQRERMLEIAGRQARQLGRLIDDLLDVARITQGRMSLRKERISLCRVIQNAVEATRLPLEQRNHYLSVSVPSDDVWIEADPARAEQIFANLLMNATKYTAPGGQIALFVERRGDEAVIRVRDSGMGIAPDVLPHVFDLFTQSPRALARAEGGLGVGLTIARRLVELHGGRIEAHSEGPGKGAEFVVRLPALPAVVGETVAAPVTPGLRVLTRIVVVEDNADTAESLTVLLEVLGHQVRVVNDGSSALAVAQANLPDVMIVDIGLPGMDGYELARRVRQHPELKRIMLIALTGYGSAEDRQRALAAGFDYHIVKPVDVDALQGLVARFERSVHRDPSSLQ